MDTPKSAASVRPRWIGPLMAELSAMKPGTDGYIFGNGSQPLDERSVLQYRVRPVLRKLGLPKGTGWHCFRRLHVSLLQAAGASPIESLKLVGHSNSMMTLNYMVIEANREAELVTGVERRLLAGAY